MYEKKWVMHGPLCHKSRIMVNSILCPRGSQKTKINLMRQIYTILPMRIWRLKVH
jgi:hypothetical protein